MSQISLAHNSPLAQAVCNLHRYDLSGLKMDELPSTIRDYITYLIGNDPLVSVSLSFIGNAHVNLRHAAVCELCKLLEEVCRERDVAMIPATAQDASPEIWWQEVQWDPVIAAIVTSFAFRWQDALRVLVEGTNALVWLQKEISPPVTWSIKQQRRYRDQLLVPIIEGANEALSHLDDYMYNPALENRDRAVNALWSRIPPCSGDTLEGILARLEMLAVYDE